VTDVARDLAEVVPAPSAVAIGVFDGVHRGHRVLVDRAVERARAEGLRAVAVTFDPHPMTVVRPDAVPLLLQSVDDRVAALAAAGVDLVVVLPFTAELSRMTPESFVAHVLAGPLQARAVVVGGNFRFGHRAAGDVAALVELGATHGFVTEGVELLPLGDDPVSSTAVRSHLAEGDVAWVTDALGRPWTCTGEVVRGDQRGRTIGFPTANVRAPSDVVRPANGVYAGHATLLDADHGEAGTWDCVVNVGTRPTFDGVGTTVEAHLLDAPEGLDLYGRKLRVAFLHRVRDERRFAGPDELVAQIDRDVATAVGLLG
jgi:riboflavin kinase/FMN adenylyltransferase